MFHSLKNVIWDRLRSQGLSSQVEAARVVEVFKEELAKRFGQSAVACLRRATLRGETLEVSLTSAALASELRMSEFAIIDQMRAKLNNKSYRLRIFA